MKKFLLLILAFASLDSGLAQDEARFCEADVWKTATPQDMDLLENPNFWCEEHGLRLIHRAVLASTGVFQAFLEKKPILNIPNRKGRTALMLAAKSRTPLLANIQLLVGAGADPDLQDNRGSTALVLAIARGHLEIVKALVNAGADPNMRDSRDDAALHWAARGGDAEIFQILINAGADPDMQSELGNTALFWAAFRGHSEIFQILVKAGADLNLQNEWGDTVLNWVAATGNLLIVQDLVNVGAGLDLQNESGRTALFRAAFLGHLAIVQFLVNAGADPNLQDDRGDTALFLGGEGRESGNRRSFGQRRSRSELAKRRGRHRPDLGGERRR